MSRYTMAGALLIALGSPLWAGTVDISSPDGRWVATLDTGDGQIGQLDDLAFDGTSHLFETLQYVELQDGRGSVRVEDEFVNSFLEVGEHGFFGRMEHRQLPLSINVFGEMLDGPSGGLQLDIQYENKGTDILSFKPFYYVDWDVNDTAGSDGARPVDWNGDGVLDGWEQRDNFLVWFVSKKSIKSMEVQPFPSTRDWLDDGARQLRDIFDQGPDDLAGALSQDKIVLEPGQTHVWSLGLGGAGIPEPATLSLLALAALGLHRRR